MLEIIPGTYFYEFLVFCGLLFTGYKIAELFSPGGKNTKEPLNNLTNEKVIDLVHGQETLNFIDRIVKEKYSYHLYLTLMPIYLDRKIPEKKKIQELKEKIYVAVVGSLSVSVKNEVLRFFTEKGIEIYVHERIIILMNETDFKNAEKFTEAFRDLNANKIDQIMA
jgi:hypothetical protein